MARPVLRPTRAFSAARRLCASSLAAILLAPTGLSAAQPAAILPGDDGRVAIPGPDQVMGQQRDPGKPIYIEQRLITGKAAVDVPPAPRPIVGEDGTLVMATTEDTPDLVARAAAPGAVAGSLAELAEGGTAAIGSPTVLSNGEIPRQPRTLSTLFRREVKEEDPLAALPPPVRQQELLSDGDDQQYVVAVDRRRPEPTYDAGSPNSLFVNPPNTSGIILDLRRVLIYTLRNNPTIGAARWRIEDAGYAVDVARAAGRPQATMLAASGPEVTHIEAQPRAQIQQRTETSIRVSQILFDFGRTRQDVDRAESLRQARVLEKENVVEETVLAAVSAYLDLLAADRLLESAQENVAAHERIVALVDKNVEGGNLSEAERQRAITRLDRAKTSALDFENGRDRARNNFRRITGLEPGRLEEPLLSVDGAFQLTESSLDIAIEANPAVQSLFRELQSLEHQRRTANKVYLPSVGVEVVGGYQENVLGSGSWAGDSRAMVTATWTPYDGGAAVATKRQLFARIKETEQLLVELRNSLKQDAYNIISVLRTTQGKRIIFDEQVETSQRVVDLYAKQFEAGRRSLLELLDAQADLAVSQEESISTRYENIAAALASLRVQNILTETLFDELDLPEPQVDVARR